MLTKELCLSCFDESNGLLYWKYREDAPKKWNSRFAGKPAGWKNDLGYFCVSINNTKYKVHRIVFMMHHGYLPEEVDHINNDRSDNRIENLRAANATNNKHNSLKAKNNTSGIKGVSWHKTSWRCFLWNKNKSKEVGGFKTKELAKEFIELWREMAHGQFANHG